jgi:hypothetical protein
MNNVSAIPFFVTRGDGSIFSDYTVRGIFDERVSMTT